MVPWGDSSDPLGRSFWSLGGIPVIRSDGPFGSSPSFAFYARPPVTTCERWIGTSKQIVLLTYLHNIFINHLDEFFFELSYHPNPNVVVIGSISAHNAIGFIFRENGPSKSLLKRIVIFFKMKNLHKILPVFL